MTKSGSNLLTWSDPKKSGMALGSILSALLLVKYVNLLSLFFYLSTFALIASGLAEYSGRLVTGTGFVTKFKPQTKTIVSDTIEYFAPHVVTVSKKIELKIQSLYTSVDVETTLRASVLSFVLYKLTSSISLWTLLFVSTLLAFTVPPVYLANKELVDEHVSKLLKLGKEKSAEYCKLAEEKLGPNLEKAKKAAEPVFKLIESKLPIRTAGSTVSESTPVSSTEPTASTTSSTVHESSTIKKVPVPATEPTEVDFNQLGEELKKEAQNATSNAETFTKEKIDAPPSL